MPLADFVEKQQTAQLLFFDIESSGLNADFATTLCVGYKWANDKRVTVLDIQQHPTPGDSTSDRELLRAFSKVWSGADVVAGWFSKRFDEPFINSRLLLHKLPMLRPVAHVDLWGIARKHLKLHSNRLAAVGEFYGLTEKTAIKPAQWLRALAGHKPSLKYIVEHCRRDILSLEDAYKLMRPLVRTHPRMVPGDTGRCRVCGSSNLRRHGTAVGTHKGRPQRVQCRACGYWDTRLITEIARLG